MTETALLPPDPEPRARAPLRLESFLFFLLFLIPAIGLDSMLSTWKSTADQEQQDQVREQTTELLTRFEQVLDPARICRDSLMQFLRPFREKPLSPTLAHSVQTRFARRFPSGSSLFLFDASGNYVPAADQRKPPQLRAWTCFARELIAPQRNSTSDRRWSQNLLKTMMGRLVTADSLRRSIGNGREVLLYGHRSFFIVTPCTFAGQRHWIMALLPLWKMPLNWELKHALRTFSKRRELVGAFQLSRQQGWGSRNMGPNLLAGLSNRLQRGESVYSWENIVFLSRLWSQNPDMALTAGIQPDSHHQTLRQTLFLGIRLALWVILLGLGLRLSLQAANSAHMHVSLADRFTGILFLLVLPLLAALLILQFDYSAQIRRFQKQQVIREAQSSILKLEQNLMDEYAALSDLLVTTLRQSVQSPEAAPELIAKLQERFSAHGLEQLLFLPRVGQGIESGWLKKESDMAGVQVKVISETLKKLGLEFDLSHLAASMPAAKADFTFLTNQMANPSSFGKLLRLKLSQASLAVFHAVQKDSAGAPAAYFYISFRDSKLRDFFLTTFSRSQPTGSTPLLIRRQDRAHLPRRKLPDGFSEALDQAETTGQVIQDYASAGSQRWFLQARAIPEYHFTVLAFPSLGLTVSAEARTRNFLLLLSASCLLMWLLGSLLLRRQLLDPILELRAKVGSLEEGNLQVAWVFPNRDQLGRLADGFNHLVQQLQLKSRMSVFLRRDLIERSHQTVSSQEERLGVAFFGLRGFSRCEQQQSPDEAFRLMNQFLGRCETAITAHGGVVDKFIGDMAMAVFRDTSRHPGWFSALAAAQDLLHSHAASSSNQEPDEVLPCGVGIAYGRAVSGCVGSLAHRLDFTVIGDLVNVAARLEKCAGKPDSAPIITTGFVSPIEAEGLTEISLTALNVKGRIGVLQVRGFKLSGARKEESET